jgi:DNA-directed RNA polymerase
MVKPYGGTRYSCREYVAEWYSEKSLKNEHDPFGSEAMMAITQLSNLVWKALDECLDRPNAVMKWLQDVARILGHEGSAVHWTSPLGLKIKQRYVDTKATRIRTLLGEKISFVKWQEPLSDLDKVRQANGISPNFVHSLDASVAQSTANYAKDHDIHSLAMVHDSFATHCNKCDRLSVLIRKSASEIFSIDLLAKFRDEIKQQTKKELPDLPLYGSLDPLEVLGSDYFFA